MVGNPKDKQLTQCWLRDNNNVNIKGFYILYENNFRNCNYFEAFSLIRRVSFLPFVTKWAYSDP